jgi:hypothetical protein
MGNKRQFIKLIAIYERDNLDDGELEIDNGATERANRDIAVGRGN